MICTREGSSNQFKRNLIFLFVGMCLASIPGFLLAPYSINVFDEPYQIINSLDWKNAAYSPLSSWLGNLFGSSAGWNYLNFRYLSTSLHFVTILICAIYSLRISVHANRIIIISWFATLYMLLDRTSHYLYGWDNWTELGVAACIIAFLSYYRAPKFWKLTVLCFLLAITSLLRLPNIIILILGSALLGLHTYFTGQRSLLRSFIISLSFILVALIVAGLIIVLLFGSIPGFLNVLTENPISEHSLGEMVFPQFKQFLLCIFYSLLTFFSYAFLKKYGVTNKFILFLSISVLTAIFFLSLTFNTGFNYGSSNRGCIGINLLLFSVLFVKTYKENQRFLLLILTTVFILSWVPSFGSNGGFIKCLAWPVLPILISLDKRHKITKPQKITAGVWIAAFFFFNIFALYQPSFLDESVTSLSHKIQDTNTVYDGMITSEERANLISEVASQSKPYIENGYKVLVLKQGNDFIWEYMMLEPNKYQRNKFGNWHAFNDKNYVDSVMNYVNGSYRPVLVMYMQWKDTVNPPLMYKVLEQNMICVKDGRGYSFWISHP